MKVLFVLLIALSAWAKPLDRCRSAKSLAPQDLSTIQGELADLLIEAGNLRGQERAAIRSLLEKNIARLRGEIEKATGKTLDPKSIRALVDQRLGMVRADEEQAQAREKNTRQREQTSRVGWTLEPHVLEKGFLPEESKNPRLLPGPNGEPVVVYECVRGNGINGRWKQLIKQNGKSVRLSVASDTAELEAIRDGNGKLFLFSLADGLFEEQAVSFPDPSGANVKTFRLSKILPASEEENFFEAKPLVYRDTKGQPRAIVGGRAVGGAGTYYQIDPKTGKASLVARIPTEHGISQSADGAHLYAYGFEAHPTKSGDGLLVVRDLADGGKTVMTASMPGPLEKLKHEDVNVERGTDGRLHAVFNHGTGKTFTIYSQGGSSVDYPRSSSEKLGTLLPGAKDEMYYLEKVDKDQLDYYVAGSPQKQKLLLPGCEIVYDHWTVSTDQGPIVVVEGAGTLATPMLYIVQLRNGIVHPVTDPDFGTRLVDIASGPGGQVLALFQKKFSDDLGYKLLQLYGAPK